TSQSDKARYLSLKFAVVVSSVDLRREVGEQFGEYAGDAGDDPATAEADHVWKSSVVARIELLPFGKDFGVGFQGIARRTRELDPDNPRQRKNLLQNLRGYLDPRAFRKSVGVELLLRGRGESFA